MRPQQLISAGFAITALAAASIPAVGWTLLGDGMERPSVSVQASSWEAPSLFIDDAPGRPFMVSLRFPDPSDPAHGAE